MRAVAAGARPRERDPASLVGEWGWFGARPGAGGGEPSSQGRRHAVTGSRRSWIASSKSGPRWIDFGAVGHTSSHGPDRSRCPVATAADSEMSSGGAGPREQLGVGAVSVDVGVDRGHQLAQTRRTAAPVSAGPG
jgi:hypothetical protein